MLLEGKVWKSGKWWLAELPALDYLTQGRTKKEALRMAVDIVATGIDKRGFKVVLVSTRDGKFILETNDSRPVIAHMLFRLRQKQGLTLREASARMGSTSPNAFGVYEQGRAVPSFKKLEALLRILRADHALVLRCA